MPTARAQRVCHPLLCPFSLSVSKRPVRARYSGKPVVSTAEAWSTAQDFDGPSWTAVDLRHRKTHKQQILRQGQEPCKQVSCHTWSTAKKTPLRRLIVWTAPDMPGYAGRPGSNRGREYVALESSISGATCRAYPKANTSTFQQPLRLHLLASARQSLPPDADI